MGLSQRFLILIIGIFVSNILIFLNSAELSSVNPRFFIFLAMPFFALRLFKSGLRIHGLGVYYGLILLFQIVFLANSRFWEEGTEVIKKSLYSFLVVLIFLKIFEDDKLYDYFPKVLIFCAVMCSLLNYYEFFFTTPFMKVPGRSSGFFINPNASGFGLMLYYLLCVDHIKKRKYRILFSYTVWGAIFLTLSRGAMLIWLILMCSYFIERYKLKGVFAISIFLICLPFLGNFIIESVREKYIEENLSTERIDKVAVLFSGGDEIADNFQKDSRVNLANIAFNFVMDNPFSGQTGASRRLNEKDSDMEGHHGAHNMYLEFALNFGIFGLLVYPVFLLVLFSKGSFKQNWKYFILFFFWGFFSHNLINQYFVIVVLAYMTIHFKKKVQYIR